MIDASKLPVDVLPIAETKCAATIEAIGLGLQVNARLWRAPGECSVWSERKCNGDKQACPFRR